MTRPPAANQMILELLLDIQAQIERIDAIMRAMIAEARTLNDELRTMRENSSFRRAQTGDLI